MRRRKRDQSSEVVEGSGGREGLRRDGAGVKDDLYAELWRACAGPVYLPRAGEKVFYFPQGHLEQVAAFTQHQQDGHMEIPVYDLPSKILCKVISVHLKAEDCRDEVFAQVTLIPELMQDELSSEDGDTCDNIPCRTKTYSFSKILTPSDTSTHGGFSIPRRYADECFPPLDMTHEPSTQELVAKDLHGSEWNFRHIYRGQPKRHLLTSGWSTFVNSKKLVAGDSCIFVSGDSGEIRIGIRRAMKQHSYASTSSSLLSGHSMQLGILASASHAVATGSLFTVYYHPWTNPFEFIVPVEKYMKSAEMDYSIGTRVQTVFEVEECARRNAGTIIGNEDMDNIKWPGSEWRCLKVQWDAIEDTYRHPKRVCPWWIEPLESVKKKRTQISPLANKEDIIENLVKAASQCYRDLQGQDNNGVHSPLPLQNPPSTDLLLSLKITNFRMEKPNQLPYVMQEPLLLSLGNSMSFLHEDISTSCSNVNSTGSESQGWPSSESKDENYGSFGLPGSCGKYKLFGVSLLDRQPELPSQQFADFSKISIPPMCVTSRKTCTKVLKVGTALGRAIDLKCFPGYDELISELDRMFDFGGSLINGSSGWHVTCIDDDGDMIVLGDYPWQDFQSMVQKMIICPRDGVENLNPSSSADPTSL